MNDTQWPRYEVFLKERPTWPHRNAGSVHAVDGEMALQNARDVFVRRPTCLSLWVVPASAIVSRTVDEPGVATGTTRTPPDDELFKLFQVFRKVSQRQSMAYVEHCGEVRADSPGEALDKAAGYFPEPKAYVWWVIPDEAIIRSDEDDPESMFAPAEEKSYRLPKEYRVLAEMMEAKNRHESEGSGF